MRKILTALSGGVDSAVAAALLVQQGFEVGAATMLLHPGGGVEARAAGAIGAPFSFVPLGGTFPPRGD